MKKHRACATLLPVALLAFGHAALAQQPPSAGGQMQQIPPTSVLPRAPPEIRIEERATPPPSRTEQVKILVRSLRVTGATQYPEPELIALTAFTPNSELTLADLQQMAARITAHYRSNGFFVAQAYLPAQEIRNNEVNIVVAEGRYGKVDLRNRTPLADRVARDALSGLNPGDAIAFEPLESRLLLLSDLPGVQVRSTLVPGASVGASDLIVDVTPGPRVSGVVEADNAGNRYTGANRIGATVNLNNPLGLGDVASLRVLTSGEGLQYARASYQLQVGRGQVGVAYSRLHYELGKEFEPLGAHGTASIASVFGRYPLVRSRNGNLYAQLAFDAKTFRDELDAVPSVTDKKSRVLMASLYGDHTDNLGGSGLSTYSVTLAGGDLDIETPSARAEDALTARTQGRFNKVSFHAMRVQRLGGGPFSVAGTISGQLASKNLDVSEKMQLGGMHAVRGYPEGEAYADQGYVATLEGRMDLPAFAALPGRMQLIAFVDHGSVTLNKNPWTAGSNRRTLSAAGVGAVWSDPGNFMVRTYYARALGDEPALSAPDKSGRFWIHLAKYF